MNRQQLFAKRDLYIRAAHACASTEMWKIWMSKAMVLHHRAMLLEDE